MLVLCQLFLYRPLGAKSLTAGSVGFLKESTEVRSALGSQRQNVLECIAPVGFELGQE